GGEAQDQFVQEQDDGVAAQVFLGVPADDRQALVDADVGAACVPDRVGVALEGPAEQCADQFLTQAPLGEVLGLGVDGEGLVEGPTVPGGGACEGSPHTVVELATGGAAGVLTGRQQGDEVLVPHPGAL